jgi:hypothetical protein
MLQEEEQWTVLERKNRSVCSKIFNPQFALAKKANPIFGQLNSVRMQKTSGAWERRNRHAEWSEEEGDGCHLCPRV